MKFRIPKLPYGFEELSPAISEKALKLHYSGHLSGYVKTLNSMPEIALMDKTKNVHLEDIILKGKHELADNRSGVIPPGSKTSKLYNISAQIYNHTFFFKSLTPRNGGNIKGDIYDIIMAQYGSIENFNKKIIAKGMNLFGSGWVWIVLDDESQLEIIKGLDAETPIVYRGLTPILCIDVWEHAYYVDYENDKHSYLKSVVEDLLNWDFANVNLKYSK